MPKRLVSFTLLLSSTLLSVAALAQVTVDPRALDPLQPAPPKPAQTRPQPAKPDPQRATPRPNPPRAATPAPPAQPPASNSGMTIRPTPGNPAQPTVPAAPPPGVTLPPPIAVPTRPAQPAAPAIVSPDAPGTNLPLPGGLRITFGTGHADLNPNTEAAIRGLVRSGPGAQPLVDGSSFTVTTYAAGTPEDPSSARRLSLSRALAVRSVLIGQGVASVRIYVKALGPASPGFADGPPDRADIVIAANALPSPPAPATTKPTR